MKTIRILTLLVLLASTAFGAIPWIRLDQSGFEIWTDAGETKAKQALRALQQTRQILLAMQSFGAPSSRTVRLILFRSDAEFARFLPLGQAPAAGFYLPGRQYDYIVMKNGGARGIPSVVRHEYLHSFLHDRNLPVPHWFDEGMAELFSNVESTRSEIRLGTPINSHVRRLLADPDTDLRTLFSPGNDPLFYAKSWALVRLFTLEEPYRSHLDRFLALVSQGHPHATAVEKAFGKSLAEVAADVRRSLCGTPLTPWVLKSAPPPLEEQSQPVLQPPLRKELVVADLLENLQRFEEARSVLTDLAKQNPYNPDIESQLGDIALRQGHPEQAFQHYSRAIQFGTGDPRIYFEHAMLRRDDDSARRQVIEDLRRAVELNPSYTEAFQQLNAITLRDQSSAPRPSNTGWKNRKGDRRVEGELVKLDCGATPVRFVLNTREGELALFVTDPSQVVIGSDASVGAELNCGSMPPRAVAVEYIAASKEITAIQFK